MRNLRLISTTVAILLLGAGTVSAQSIKTDETPARAPAAQQIVPAEKMAPALKSDQRKAPETTGQAMPTAPEADKNAPGGAATKSSSDANGGASVKNKNGAGAASPSGKSANEGKSSTTGQGAVNEDVVGGPSHRHYRHYRHYRHCWTNIFGYRSCWY
jgi:type IV secretory pathway VirB10-like protein